MKYKQKISRLIAGIGVLKNSKPLKINVSDISDLEVVFGCELFPGTLNNVFQFSDVWAAIFKQACQVNCYPVNT